jgi:hypothetical protein
MDVLTLVISLQQKAWRGLSPRILGWQDQLFVNRPNRLRSFAGSSAAQKFGFELPAGVKIVYHDPYVPSFNEHGLAMENTPLTDELLERCTMCIIATDHQAVDYERVVAKVPHVLDMRNATKRFTGHRDKVTLLESGFPA